MAGIISIANKDKSTRKEAAVKRDMVFRIRLCLSNGCHGP